MSSANVRNTEAIESVKAALAKFAEQVDEGLTEIEAESRRMLDWLEHDRPRYWKTRVREAWDAVDQAKANLNRCLMYPLNDERPSCTEEREALKEAEAHRAYCEEKAERLKHWCREVRHEILEYEGRVGQLKSIAEIDVVKAISVLTKILHRIAEYQALQTPQAGSVASVRNVSAAAASEAKKAEENNDKKSNDEGTTE